MLKPSSENDDLTQEGQSAEGGDCRLQFGAIWIAQRLLLSFDGG